MFAFLRIALTDVGVPRDHDGARGRVDGWQTRQVLSDLLEVRKGGPQLLHDRAHAAQRRALQLLAAVQRVTELEQLEVVLAHVVHERSRRGQLSQRQLVVVSRVEHVDEVCVERVHVVQARELVQDLSQFLVVVRLSELHLQHHNTHASPRDKHSAARSRLSKIVA